MNANPSGPETATFDPLVSDEGYDVEEDVGFDCYPLDGDEDRIPGEEMLP